MLRSSVMLALILLAVVTPTAYACPTMLNLVPTADVMEPNSIRLSLENDGYSRVFASDSDNYVFLQMGVTSRLEAGVDFYCYKDKTDTVLNAKYQLMKESDTRPGLAIGTMNISEGYTPKHYVSGVKSFGANRIHLGTIGDRHKQNLMAGYERSIGSCAGALVDYIDGDAGYKAVGAWWQPKGGPCLYAAVAFPNIHGETNLTFVNVSWTWSLSKSQ